MKQMGRWCWVIVVALCALIGCGKQGPLYLPKSVPHQPVSIHRSVL